MLSSRIEPASVFFVRTDWHSFSWTITLRVAVCPRGECRPSSVTSYALLMTLKHPSFTTQVKEWSYTLRGDTQGGNINEKFVNVTDVFI